MVALLCSRSRGGTEIPDAPHLTTFSIKSVWKVEDSKWIIVSTLFFLAVLTRCSIARCTASSSSLYSLATSEL